ncbi:MAG: hypothetical protein II237_04435, partial [Clostridia bacterium]|nr:hypothetical protein [Clostridia bacterium]
EINATEEQYRIFLFYSLMYCVDFMGEKGATFNDKVVKATEVEINRLNDIYEQLSTDFYRIKTKAD